MKPIKVEEIQKLARNLSTTAASPEFLNLIRNIHAADDDHRLETATQVAKVETLVEHGVSLPEHFRISTREFEEPENPEPKAAEALPHIAYDGDRIVFTFEGLVTVVEQHTKPTENNGEIPEFIQQTLCDGIEEIGDFVVQPEFQSLLAELYVLPHEARLKFVQEIIIDDHQRLLRGIRVPEGMVIQRSTFADGRPTLFCVSKMLPLAHPWHRVTITFDSSLAEVSAQ